MRRNAISLLKGLLVSLVMVAVVSTASFRDADHQPMDLLQILAEHQAEVERHGHAHEDIHDLMHHFHGHAHDGAEHDHNAMSMPPRADAAALIAPNRSRSMANDAMLIRRSFDLDRPPRV